MENSFRKICISGGENATLLDAVVIGKEFTFLFRANSDIYLPILSGISMRSCSTTHLGIDVLSQLDTRKSNSTEGGVDENRLLAY